MCQTEVISKSIVYLSKKSFAQRLNILSPQVTIQKGILTRLNNQLDELYDMLYGCYPEITEADYKFLNPYLSVLIRTLKELHEAYKKYTLDEGIKMANERLKMNISAIEEINHDIRDFKINIYQNPRYHEVVLRAKNL